MSSGTIAVIDVGTQTTNLLVTDSRGEAIVRRTTSTRLGESLHSGGVLIDSAMHRTVEAIVEHAAAARALKVSRTVVVGTAACRRAKNSGDFVAMVRNAAGLDLEILSTTDEASLAFVGATTGLPHGDKDLGSTIVIDIGGGSTEFTIGVDGVDYSHSIPFGAVTSTESHLTTDPPRPEDLTNLIGAVSDEFEEIGRTTPGLLTPSRVIGIGGTIVTIAAVELGLATFDEGTLHGMSLSRDAAEDVFRTVATESLGERVLNPGLPKERADIIVAGCCILVAAMRRLHIDGLTVSTRSLLDGVAHRERLRQ